MTRNVVITVSLPGIGVSLGYAATNDSGGNWRTAPETPQTQWKTQTPPVTAWREKN